MSQSTEENLLEAIKKDDIKAFEALMENAQCGAYRLGRFPVLSLMYLYKSRKLLSSYEQRFIKIASYEALGEPTEISKKFSAAAGKCLRLYLNEVISPLEMLLVLDKTRRLKRVFPLTRPSAAVKERLKSIYFIKYSLSVKFEGDDIIIDRRPLSVGEKKRIAAACLCSVLAVGIAVGTPLTVNAFKGMVTGLDQIDFASENEYTLKRDIILPDNYTVEKINCTIVGGGNKIVLGKGATLGELNGKVSGLTIESTGNAIFTTVSESAVIENIIVNISASVTAAAGTALVAETNFGTIDGVTVNVSGKINALAPSAEANAELIFGGIVQNNDYKYSFKNQTVYAGTVKNCTVNYSQFEVVGEVGANASFGGVAGINAGYVRDCTVTGGIAADTVDIAGVCSVNSGLLSGNANGAEISQTTSSTEWNPITCGIVINNTGAVENCENRGSLSAVSNCGEFDTEANHEYIASCAGIAYLNGGSQNAYIKNCANLGRIVSRAENRSAYAAGVCLSSSGAIEGCKNGGAVTVSAGNGNGVCAGGIAAVTYSNIIKSVNGGAISATGSGEAYIGGIAAHSFGLAQNCLSDGDITVTAKNVCAGGIIGFSDVTSNGIYISFGTARNCISRCKLTVSLTENEYAYIGGIAGLMRQARAMVEGGDTVTYCAGSITNCYFTGECTADISYFGNIVGACGANIYENNLSVWGNTVYANFADNFYPDNSFNAFGTAIADDGSFVSAKEDKGAAKATAEDIQNSEVYKSILNSVE